MVIEPKHIACIVTIDRMILVSIHQSIAVCTQLSPPEVSWYLMILPYPRVRLRKYTTKVLKLFPYRQNVLWPCSFCPNIWRRWGGSRVGYNKYMLWNRNDLLSPVPVPTLELWKSLVPVPDPVPAPAPDSDIFSTVFQQQNFFHNILPFHC